MTTEKFLKAKDLHEKSERVLEASSSLNKFIIKDGKGITISLCNDIVYISDTDLSKRVLKAIKSVMSEEIKVLQVKFEEL